MAHQLGFNTATLNRWMTGKRQPEPFYCLKLARAFDVPPNQVLEMAGYGEMSALFPHQ
jgi:DNA-binding transcriptional regulator YdaS (Cro superfamily)